MARQQIADHATTKGETMSTLCEIGRLLWAVFAATDRAVRLFGSTALYCGPPRQSKRHLPRMRRQASLLAVNLSRQAFANGWTETSEGQFRAKAPAHAYDRNNYSRHQYSDARVCKFPKVRSYIISL